jgi:hypothetical protein
MNPQWLGFSFLVGRQHALVVDEDDYVIRYQIGVCVHRMNKPVFFERLGKHPNGTYYLA